MKKVLFATNVPSPYRMDFFNELGKFCELTVCFERKTASDRDGKWKGRAPENFKAIQLDLKPYKEDRSRGNALKNYIKHNEFDIIILTNYSSPAAMSAISWCKRHKKPFYIEYDGGFYKKDRFPASIIKKYLLCGAKGHFTTCEEHKKYLLSIGIDENTIFKYPFTSVRKEDIEKAEAYIHTNKQMLRDKLNITEDTIVLSIGQFIPRKGFDILMKSAAELDNSIGIYIVGGLPTDYYLNLKKALSLNNVHFVGFKTKDELAEYYAAADLFVLPTREDIWGLVINESMAYGLPCITTERCIAGLELIENGINGYIVPVEDCDIIAEKIKLILEDEALYKTMSIANRKKIKNYTIEQMAARHIKIFNQILGENK